MARIIIFAALLAIALARPQKVNFKEAFDPLSERIVGGSTVLIFDYPYIAQVFIGSYFCGGSVISPNWIITAAHCVVDNTVSDILVRVGTPRPGDGGVVFRAEELHVHPEYNDPPIWSNAGPDYDVALIKLSGSLTYSPFIRNVQLIDSNQNIPEGTMATVAGWGLQEEDGFFMASVLRAVSVPIIAHDRCQNSLQLSDLFFTPRMLCAGFDEGGKDACSGDSGGPLVVDNVLVGIVSWGRGCARPGVPGIYTDVSNVREYIRSITSV